MKLTAFRIRNYRAIVDTGWVNLSPDNITALIGQNESGKTSVLEALNSFYTGEVHEDILRSDLSLPQVSCCFNLINARVTDFINVQLLNPNVFKKIEDSGHIHINRKWTDQNKSYVFFGDDQLIASFEEELKKEEQTISELEESVHLIIEETKKRSAYSEKYTAEKLDLGKRLAPLQKKESKLLKIIARTTGSKKELAEKEFKSIESEINELKAGLEKITESIDTNSAQLEELLKASKYAGLFLESGRKYKSLKQLLESLQDKLQQKTLELRFSTEHKKLQLLSREIRDIESDIEHKNDELNQSKQLFRFYSDCLSLALSEAKPDNIETIVTERQEEMRKILSPDELARTLFKHLPSFKLFEDFSSLLPNRIDLDDILNTNSSVEGYNAVKNFLIVSGLDASFFTEQNNRILKQKIENLNGELTLHFQDYWRQNVGRNNKIKINFDLEHYDFSHPTKKGKPYLEFWIKDEHERLYPKQRSRGVRWFLSFYLELKATSLASKSGANVLLIDEPGLSLHTRAQEDVLKVFEDMKDNIQIVYSTHSPHLVDVSKLFRILAVQRADEYNDKSESLIFDTRQLSQASGDTLSPIYSLLGTRLSESSFLQERNNLIVEDIHIFYYLNSFFRMLNESNKLYFLPANGAANIPTLVNLMIGWNLNYAVLLMDNHSSRNVFNELSEKIYSGEVNSLPKNILIIDKLEGIENLFSTIDFKKFVLQKRVGITESNLEYIENNNLSRKDLATSFLLKCQEESLSLSDFDEDTRENFNHLLKEIKKLLDN